MPVATTTFAVASLLVGLGSNVVAVTLAVSEMIVPDAVPAVTFRTGENVAVPPDASALMVQVIVPVAPTAGVEQLQPDGVGIETKVVLAGSASVKVTVEAEAGPLFLTIWE